jgi:tetratricopeptide (TPR) repeat protein
MKVKPRRHEETCFLCTSAVLIIEGLRDVWTERERIGMLRSCQWSSVRIRFIFLVCVFLLAAVQSAAYSLADVQALERNHDWNGLLRYGQAWTKAEPNNANAWAAVSVAYFFLDRPDLALEPTKKGVELAPREAGAWTGLGHVYATLKQYPEAVDAYTHAVELKPDNGNFWNNLAAAYSEQGDYAKTLETLERQAKAAGPHQNAELWYNLGNGLTTIAASTWLHSDAGKPKDHILREAVYAYKQALRLNPRYANAWNNLGVAQEAVGDTQEALQCYQRAGALGDRYGAQNYRKLQEVVAAAAAAAAAAAEAAKSQPVCTLCIIKNRDRYQWDHDVYLQSRGPRP